MSLKPGNAAFHMGVSQRFLDSPFGPLEPVLTLFRWKGRVGIWTAIDGEMRRYLVIEGVEDKMFNEIDYVVAQVPRNLAIEFTRVGEPDGLHLGQLQRRAVVEAVELWHFVISTRDATRLIDYTRIPADKAFEIVSGDTMADMARNTVASPLMIAS